ncbi:MAG: hypothetical protein M8349_07030 [ANME-2 cluster archaeon]|nr:hypothetical protein [ANME-2 cluster archaeon]
MNSDNYINKLQQTIIRLTVERDVSIKHIQELEQENEKLKKKLLFYENPHTPPSANRLQKIQKTPNDNKEPKKRGAPKGHRGATRPTPEPDEVKDVVAQQCENCGSFDLEKLDNFEKSVIEDISLPQKIKVTQFNRWEVRCQHCGHQVKA